MPENKKIPTILLTGFLGSGKTTMLNRLIQFYRHLKTVVLVNEFGQIGIDGQLLVPGNYHKIELNKGSLFCICLRTDFIFQVEKIACEIQPELLIIEATGLADTSEMEKMLALPNLIDKIHLKCCLCLVDCVNFLKIKDHLKAPGIQIQSADLVLLNKIDLVSESQLVLVEKEVRAFAASVPIYKTNFAQISLTIIEQIDRSEMLTKELPGEGRPDLVVSVSLQGRGEFTRLSWEDFKSLLEPFTLRVKGFILLEGNPFFLDATLNQWQLTPIAARNQTENALVVIGQNLDQEKIERKFQACVRSH